MTKRERNRCNKCNEFLHPDREVWLELDQRTNTYTDDEKVPEEYSQGWFPFGSACAKWMLAEHKLALENEEVPE